MKSKMMIVLLLATAVAGQLIAGELDDILSKHYEAVGGKDTVMSLKSMKATAKIVISSPQGDMEIPLDMKTKDNTKARVESNFQGMVMVQATDGENSWQINPMMGSSEPQDMSADEAKDMKMRADISGDLFNYKEKGYTLEYAGKEDVEGTETFKIVVNDGDDKRYYFLDTEYYLIIKSSSEVNMMGATQIIESFPSDYKKVNGHLFPHAISQKMPMGDMTITFENVEFNVDIDDEIFKKPAATAEAK